MVSRRNLSRVFWALPFGALGVVAAARVLPGAPHQAEAPTLVYTKVLKGSIPEYVRITVRADGLGTYDGRKLSQPPEPRSMQVSSEVTQQLFALAKDLGDFQNVSLASHRRVANLGLKTFEYRADGVSYKTEFNYTENRTGQRLTNLFEGICAVEQHIGALEFSSRYDPLGLPHELTLIQMDLDDKALVDPQLMAPILETISKDSRYMHIAQMRARNILARIGSN